MTPLTPHDCEFDAETISETHLPLAMHPVHLGGGEQAAAKPSTTRTNVDRIEGTIISSGKDGSIRADWNRVLDFLKAEGRA